MKIKIKKFGYKNFSSMNKLAQSAATLPWVSNGLFDSIKFGSKKFPYEK